MNNEQDNYFEKLLKHEEDLKNLNEDLRNKKIYSNDFKDLLSELKLYLWEAIMRNNHVESLYNNFIKGESRTDALSNYSNYIYSKEEIEEMTQNHESEFAPLETYDEQDIIRQPKHYKLGDQEVIKLIEVCNYSYARYLRDELNIDEMFVAHAVYLFGSILKYRLRAGKKDEVTKDINKALEFENMLIEYLGRIKNNERRIFIN